ncbi:arsenate reductase/protein-tyrosine-phosphatase family protein [Actinoplanes xinjiangensis]|uniref:ArsR family transcriptional regulator n=1 Tax=Actinoplanes xinjiangensis TaxID=512350 RepID=A0A316EUM5_9ACTN|nr:ArsR family transcriptional regulator [Actinoplanes xinjiangensis]PWK36021.1 ArsR family transcriptional regulator [Actinoplanes xinjiangensis]GIF42981.1 ArsR family transcriptional regulator [Actinoplanes xinjiangensis]
MQRPRSSPAIAPPDFLRLAGHPLRWQILGLLAAGDRQVGELVELIGKPQNLVSYHMGLLRRSGLVRARRSSADGRDSYQILDLKRCGELLAETGSALHPALRSAGPTQPSTAPETAAVLFLCTGNSSRSQMAEALLRVRSSEHVQARSAGIQPKPVHQDAVRVMHERGVDLSGARSKHVDEFTGDHFDHVITLCDRVREVCPPFPGVQNIAHWSTPDPANRPGGIAAFRDTAAELDERIGFLLHRLGQPAAT